MDDDTCHRIATRIHAALLRHLGEGIDAVALLQDDAEAREVLWVCDAIGDPELASLAMQYRHSRAVDEELAKRAGHTPQEATWSRNTSGFGYSQPAEQAASGHHGMASGMPSDLPLRPHARAAVAKGWLGWLRRGNRSSR